MVCRANANMFRFKVVFKDFSGGPAVKNLPCNGGDAGLIPGQGTKIPHIVEQLSPNAATPEPTHHNEPSQMKQQRSHVSQLRPDDAAK